MHLGDRAAGIRVLVAKAIFRWDGQGALAPADASLPLAVEDV